VLGLEVGRALPDEVNQETLENLGSDGESESTDAAKQSTEKLGFSSLNLQRRKTEQCRACDP
jgi:hypothetical protein